MRIRVIVAVVVATSLAFGWGAVAWSMGLYTGWAIRSMPQGDGLPEAMAAAMAEPAAYVHPPLRSEDPDPKADPIGFELRRNMREQGQHFMVLSSRPNLGDGPDFTLLKGFALELFTSGILAAIMAIAAKFGARLADRISLAFAAALFAVFAGPVVQWNFWHLPSNYAMAIGIDTYVTWLLAGLACAIIIRPERRVRQES